MTTTVITGLAYILILFLSWGAKIISVGYRLVDQPVVTSGDIEDERQERNWSRPVRFDSIFS